MMNKEKIQWSKEAVLILIKRFRQHTGLYDPSHQKYNNQNYRRRALQDILEQVVCFYPDITVHDVRTKLNYLRTQFGRENQKVLESTKTAECYEDVYVPSAYWFEDLSFLKEFIGLKATKSKKQEDNSEVNMASEETMSFEIYDANVISDDEDELLIMPPAKKPKNCIQQNEEERIKEAPLNVGYLLNTANDLLTEIKKIGSLQDRHDDSLIMFLKENIKYITDPELKDDMSKDIINVILDYKKKQRNLK